MSPKYLILLLVIGVASGQDWGGGKRNRDPCPRPTLRNGRIKPRSNGRVVKYSCNRDFVLVGESTSTCLLGEWTSETPVCATKGCSPVTPPPSGRFIYSYGGAVVRLECNPGYAPAGPPMLYCVDRFDWNGTAPVCRASSVRQSATSCDFESEDLCGWIQDASADEFDWTWQQYSTPSSHLGTGPSFDHTFGEGKGGHYLFIESSSPRILNDTARLFSPVYSPPEAPLACFTFWYHMYGSTTGRLNVYIKPESSKLSQLKPAFVRSGDQGNQWRQGYVKLDNVTENFQVLIEGVRGTGYVGDSAIDDVALATGSECQVALARMIADMSNLAPGKQDGSAVPAGASCATRCPSSGAGATEAGAKQEWTCDCRDDCLLKNSCCVDYATYCLAGGNATTPGEAKNYETTPATKATPAATPGSSSASTEAPTTAATLAISSSTVTTTSTLAPTTTTAPVTSTASTSPITTTSTTTIERATTTTTTTTTKPSTTATTTKPTTSSTTTTIKPTTTSTTPTTTTNPTTTAAITPTVRTTSTQSTATTTEEATLLPPPLTSTMIATNGLQSDDSMNWPPTQDEGKSTRFSAVGVAVIASGVLVVTGAVVLAYARNRRVATTGGRRPGAGQQAQLAEDSDVRYLRDDDDIQLDLTEATPSPAPSEVPTKSQTTSQQFADFERF